MKGKVLAISFVTVGELFYGAYKSRWGESRLATLEERLAKYVVLPYDRGLCLEWAVIKSTCEDKGYPIDDPDCWIAASARYYNCALASNNARHFRNIPGLKLITPNFN